MSDTKSVNAPTRRTPLFEEHVALGAKMVPFAGYDMPVQYPLGILKEHLWTREKAGLFDVSHMGQAAVIADDGSVVTAARALEALVPADLQALAIGQQRYTQLLADDGGILDDLMVTRPKGPGADGALFLVVNAACKDADYAHIRARLPSNVRLEVMEDRALLALQGPRAAGVMTRLAPKSQALKFMQGTSGEIGPFDCYMIRSGYTGEDGFEISLPAENVVAAWRLLLGDSEVQPVGLGARDSLRLEAGLCLYGHDIDTTTSPVEAGLAWSIQKRRREEGGFPGAGRIQAELKGVIKRKRVGLKPEGRQPAREGAEIISMLGERIGTVTSGGFAPSISGPVAMGYVPAALAAPGTRVQLVVRGKPLVAEVVPLPFVPHRYLR